jgi:hypothetical protein
MPEHAFGKLAGRHTVADQEHYRLELVKLWKTQLEAASRWGRLAANGLLGKTFFAF